MAAPQNTIAVVFDFDDTLTDDSTTKLIETQGIDSKEFWLTRFKALVDNEWNPTLAYLKLLLDNVGTDKPLGTLTNQALRTFGATLEFYTGIPELFDDLRAMMQEHPFSNPSIEFYIISGGLEEIIRGSRIAKYFMGIWGCRFEEENGMVKHIKNAITFTEKTKYLFEINKGLNLQPPEPYAVNRAVDPLNRRIPFENMIYLGDGLTDVPCFSLLSKSNGRPFGVFDPTKQESPKKAMEQLVVPHRVDTMNSPRYGKHDDLGALLRAAVKGICLQMDVRMRTA